MSSAEVGWLVVWGLTALSTQIGHVQCREATQVKQVLITSSAGEQTGAG